MDQLIGTLRVCYDVWLLKYVYFFSHVQGERITPNAVFEAVNMPVHILCNLYKIFSSFKVPSVKNQRKILIETHFHAKS